MGWVRGKRKREKEEMNVKGAKYKSLKSEKLPCHSGQQYSYFKLFIYFKTIFVSMVTRIWYIIILNMSSVYYNSLFSMLRTSFIYHCISYWGSSLITVVIVLSSYPTQYCTVHYSISYMWVWLGYYSYILKYFGQKGIFWVLMVFPIA